MKALRLFFSYDIVMDKIMNPSYRKPKEENERCLLLDPQVKTLSVIFLIVINMLALVGKYLTVFLCKKPRLYKFDTCSWNITFFYTCVRIRYTVETLY